MGKPKPQRLSPGERKAMRQVLGERFQITAKDPFLEAQKQKAIKPQRLSPGERKAMRQVLGERFQITAKDPLLEAQKQKAIKPQKVKEAAQKSKSAAVKIGEKVKSAASKIGATEKYLKGPAKLAERNVVSRLGRKALRRALPGVGVGMQVGGNIAGTKGLVGGAAVGAGVSALAPKIVTRAALPVAAAAGAVDIGRAAYQAGRAHQAQKHLKQHAKQAVNAGYKVTRKHPIIGMLTGDPGLRIESTKETERKGREYYKKRRKAMGAKR